MRGRRPFPNDLLVTMAGHRGPITMAPAAELHRRRATSTGARPHLPPPVPQLPAHWLPERWLPGLTLPVLKLPFLHLPGLRLLRLELPELGLPGLQLPRQEELGVGKGWGLQLPVSWVPMAPSRPDACSWGRMGHAWPLGSSRAQLPLPSTPAAHPEVHPPVHLGPARGDNRGDWQLVTAAVAHPGPTVRPAQLLLIQAPEVHLGPVAHPE